MMSGAGGGSRKRDWDKGRTIKRWMAKSAGQRQPVRIIKRWLPTVAKEARWERMGTVMDEEETERASTTRKEFQLKEGGTNETSQGSLACSLKP